MRRLTLAALTLSVVHISAAEPRPEITNGWILNCASKASTACSSGGRYVAAVDRSLVTSGSASLSIEAERAVTPEFGGVMQVARAAAYRGKRVRFSADVRTLGVADWTGLWLRVDAADGRGLAFDNMRVSDRALTGDHQWERQSVVLDVPDSANAIFFGLVLSGSGKAWMDSARIEVVGPDVPETYKVDSTRPVFNAAPDAERLLEPRNLDFEE